MASAAALEPSLFCPCAPALISVSWLAQRVPCGFRSGCHLLDRSTNPFPSNPSFSMAAASSCGNPTLLFISTPSVTASSGPLLHRRRSQGTRSLWPVPPLHAFGAAHTPADRNTKASHPGSRQILFLILLFHPSDSECPHNSGAGRESLPASLLRLVRESDPGGASHAPRRELPSRWCRRRPCSRTRSRIGQRTALMKRQTRL
jgi:hypothetical protein